MKFSIIVPVFNSAAYIRDCLDSVIAQSYIDWECICIDDGSNDGSESIVDEYGEKDKRFKIIHQLNQGEGAARNVGLLAAQGEWIYFLDSDDIINTKVLEVCMNAISSIKDIDMVSVKMIKFVDGQFKGFSKNTNNEHIEVVDISECIDERSYRLSVWRIAYKSTLAKQVSFGYLKIGADRVYLSNILEIAKKLAKSSYEGYGYRIRAGSLVNSRMTVEKFLDDLRHRKEWMMHFSNKRKKYAESVKQGFSKSLCEYMSSQFFKMSSSDRQLCIKEWGECIEQSRHIIKSTMWFEFAMYIFGKIRFQTLAWILFYFPYWLKTHGINRKFSVSTKKVL